MIFLTVGTLFPFDRLVRAVDDAFGKGLINEEVFAQIGESSYKPRSFDSAVMLSKEVFDEYFTKASAVIGHAGMGTISLALDNHKPLLVMPRLKKYGEHVNDHQTAIAKRFSANGHLLVAYDVNEIPGRIQQLRTFQPGPRNPQSQSIVVAIRSFLDELFCKSEKV
jgi:UDP-N-acetylglucosamine transferase subunit ALG13